MMNETSGVIQKMGIKGGTSVNGAGYLNGGGPARNGQPNGRSNGSNSIKKKKRGSRRRGENEIYNAADTSVNAQATLESMLFPKSSYVIKMPANRGPGGRHQLAQDQFEDAAESAERQLKQNRTDYLGGGSPPFGFFSLHPTTLTLHPPHAVSHYYPSTPAAFNSWMRSPPTISKHGSPHTHIVGQTQFSQSSSLVVHHQHHNHSSPPQQQPPQHPGVLPKVSQRSMTQQQRTGMPAASPQQQVRIHQQRNQQLLLPSQAQGVAPGFLEFARKRQQQQQEHLKQKEVFKMNQESIQQEQLRQMQQQQRPYQAPSPRENTAAVLASMKSQHTPSRTTLIPRAHGGMPSEAVATPEQEPGMHHAARMALGHHSSYLSSPAAQMAPPPQAPRRQQSQQHATYQETPSRSPQPTPKSKPSLSSQQQPQKPALAPAVSAEGAAIDENGGAKQFVKRMITTNEESPLTTGMDQLETLPMLQYVPPDSNKSHPVREQEITNCDVLLGRGGMTNHHIGNQHFRTLVSSFRLHYCAAKKGDKGRLSKKLTNFVRHKNGRFLQKDDVDNLWYEVGDSRAHGKCAQALREGTADLNRQVANGVPFDNLSADATVPTRPQSYPPAYAVRPPPVAATTSTSSASPNPPPPPPPAYHPHEYHGGMMPHHALPPVHHHVPHHPPPPPPVAPPVPPPGDQASPRIVIRPPADNGKNPNTSRAGHSPRPPQTQPQPQPQPPKRPLVKTQSNGQAARKPPITAAAPSQGIQARPPVTAEEEGPAAASVERPMSRKSSGTRSEESGGGQYDDEESTMEEEEVTAEEDASRKRMKVQHEEHFEYI